MACRRDLRSKLPVCHLTPRDSGSIPDHACRREVCSLCGRLSVDGRRQTAVALGLCYLWIANGYCIRMKNGLIRAWDYSVMKIDLRDLKSQSVNENNNVQVRRFSATEVEQIVTSSHRPPGRQDESYFLRHLANGALVYGACFKGDPVAWRLFRPHQLNLWNWIRLEVGPTSYIGVGRFHR